MFSYKQQILSYARRLFDFFIAPPFCAYCKKFLDERTLFCDNCDSFIKPIVSCDVILNKNYTMRVLAVSAYQEPLKSLIIAKSWSDIMASQQLAELIWEKSYFKHHPCDILVPVPLHWTRAVRRGFNQAEIIAQALAQKKRCITENLVRRIKRTPFQSKLALIDRPLNVGDAFQATTAAISIAGKHIVIVDDLMTTGATIKAVAKELIPYKPASLTAVVAARII